MPSGVGIAVVASAVIGAGSTMYASEKAKDAAEDQARELREAERRKKIEAERIARETRPEGESLSDTEFGSRETEEERLGSVDDFLVPKSKSSLGSSDTGSGLGFNV